jgi:hypothetical protein
MFTLSGCIFEDNGNHVNEENNDQNQNIEYEVTINVLYNRPYHINNTTVILDGNIFLSFKNITLKFYPPLLVGNTTRLKKGPHDIKIIDKNFNQTKTDQIEVNATLYVDIFITEEYISIHQSDEPTIYK